MNTEPYWAWPAHKVQPVTTPPIDEGRTRARAAEWSDIPRMRKIRTIGARQQAAKRRGEAAA